MSGPRRFYRPMARRNAGRFPRRSGAATTGQLGNWINSVVGQFVAEAEKRRISDRALDLYTNDAMAHGIIETMTAEAVGIGLTPQMAPDAEWLGLSAEWAVEYQRAADKLFERWGLDFRCFCDAQRRLDFYGLQALAYFHWRLDGIGVFQVLYDDNPAAPIPLSLLPIDPLRLGTPRSFVDGDVCDGVEVDHNGAPVAVHIRKPGVSHVLASSEGYTRLPVTDEKTGLPRVLLVCDVRNIAEYRQDSVLASMIPELRCNQDFVSAALVRTLMANMFAVKLKHAGMGSAGARLGDTFEDRFEEMEQAMLLHLNQNEDAEFMKNDAPGPNYEKMFDSIVKRLGMATGRGAENVAREYKASYSASQANMIQSEKLIRSEQKLTLNVRFNAPALAWMLYAGAVRGQVPVKSLPHMRENLFDYTRAEWLPQPTRHIDPLKTAKAHQVEKQIGERTIREYCAEKNQNWKDHVATVAEEMGHVREEEKRRGLPEGTLVSRFFPGSAAAAQDTPEPEEHDNDKGDGDEE